MLEEQHAVGHSLRAKRLHVKDICEEMFPIYGAKCLSRKAVHNSVEKMLLMRSEL